MLIKINLPVVTQRTYVAMNPYAQYQMCVDAPIDLRVVAVHTHSCAATSDPHSLRKPHTKGKEEGDRPCIAAARHG